MQQVQWMKLFPLLYPSSYLLFIWINQGITKQKLITNILRFVLHSCASNDMVYPGMYIWYTPFRDAFCPPLFDAERCVDLTRIACCDSLSSAGAGVNRPIPIPPLSSWIYRNGQHYLGIIVLVFLAFALFCGSRPVLRSSSSFWKEEEEQK